tara:strand:+ start:292 stop:1050 length:759 start_codon:yes stop_codon:yes gene_type:complete
MQIAEILDRLELLHPNNPIFSDLRKTLLSQDKFALFRIIQGFTGSQLIEGMRKYKDDDSFNTDCFSRGQIESKLWLVNELNKLDVELGTVFLCAGWYATLATMLFESNINVDKVRSFDIDPSCVDIAEVFNKPWVMKDWKFKSSIQDINNIDYNNHTYSVKRSDGSQVILTDSPDTVINTSCEHIFDFNEWYDKIPKGKLIIVQSNNFFEVPDHVNCCKTLEDFAEQTPMDIAYEGTLELPKYNRFMRIGYK